MILYPAIDISEGKAVRLVKGDFNQVTVYEDSPLEAARAWVEAGARFLHVVDLDGARTGSPKSLDHLEQITSELHPATPAGDLEKSLLSFLETVEDDDVCVGLDVNGDESWADPASIGEAFLIVREAARNALTHAGAASVFIRVDIAPHALIASVQDDGRGFDPATVDIQWRTGK